MKVCKCGALVASRCERCYPIAHQQTTKERGYGSDWKRLSQRYRAKNPLCEMCEEKGKVTPASEVHHIEKISDAPHKRLDVNNLMSVCSDCHEEIHRSN